MVRHPKDPSPKSPNGPAVPGATKVKLSPHVLALLADAETASGLSRRQWALRAGVEPTQVSAAFAGRSWLSVASFEALLATGGHVLAMARPASDTPALYGHATDGGTVIVSSPAATQALFPAMIPISVACGPFEPGDVRK